MSRFNLIDEKWIPVRFPDGTRDELGIKDTLLRAKEIEAIEDPSPLVVASLHRFLLAVLYRALEGPSDIDEAKELFKSGLPGNKITGYLKTWQDRFWLFDAKYPFGQNPLVPPNEIEPWTKLTAEFNATTNKVLFDHTDTRSPGKREPKECARWLVATMSFSLSGGRGYCPSPSPNAMTCIPLGQDLHETLCYCLVPYGNREVMQGDSAVWEREPKQLPLAGPKRMSSGYADLFTWQSRMVLLEELPGGGISFVRFVAGEGFENSAQHVDPMQAYESGKAYGKRPLQFRDDRGTWRDLDSLFPDGSQLAPGVIAHAIALTRSNPDRFPRSVMILGQANNQAKIEFWRMERFVLPSALAGDKDIRSDIRRLLEVAESTQTALWLACKSYARHLLSRGDRKPEGKDIRGFVSQMPSIPRYWSTLEGKFRALLQSYTLEKKADEIQLEWLQEVRTAIRDSWEQHRLSVSMGDAWAIRALVKAEGPVSKKVKELDASITDFKKSLKKEEST